MVAIIAHRGASLECKENSIEAFRRALFHKVDYLEIDLHLTKEGVPVIHHDPVLDSRGILWDMTLSEIKAKAPYVPTLRELLEIPLGECGLMIELKPDGPDYKKLVTEVLKLVKGREKKSVIGSFSPEINSLLKQEAPSFPRIAIMDSFERLQDHLKAEPTYLACCGEIALKAPTKLKIWAWTINDKEVAKELVAKGVAGIITDDPGRMMCLKSQ